MLLLVPLYKPFLIVLLRTQIIQCDSVFICIQTMENGTGLLSNTPSLLKGVVAPNENNTGVLIIYLAVNL